MRSEEGTHRSVAWIVLLTVPVAIGACFACGEQSHGPADASTDAGPPDAGPDRDAGRDATAADAGDGGTTDSGPPDPAFRPLPGLPIGCRGFLVARDPAAIEPMAWGECFDGRSGCEQMEIPWGDPRERGTVTFIRLARCGEARAVMGIIRPANVGDDDMRDMLFVDRAGTVLYASRWQQVSGECMHGPLSASGEGIAFGIGIPNRYLPVEFVVVDVELGGSEEIVTLTDDQIPDQAAQDLVRGPTGAVGLEIIPSFRVGTIRDSVFRMTEAAGAANNPLLVGEYLLFNTFETVRMSVMKEDPDGTVGLYLAVAEADVMHLRTDGERIAWMEGRERLDSSTHWAQRTVRVARFTPDRTELEPRTVVELGEGYPVSMALGGGWLVVERPEGDRHGVLAVHLETGEERHILAPEGYVFSQDPLYVTEDEVALTVSADRSFIDRTVFKIDLTD